MKKLLYTPAIIISLLISSFAQEQLEIEGAIVLKEASANPSKGTVRYNSFTNDFEGWNGLYWASLTGKQFTFGGGVTDIDGNYYQTVFIGTQEWMAENLRTFKYQDGTTIDYYAGDVQWELAEGGAWCWYDNNGNFDVPYGKLYNWFAVDDIKGICPSGWHVPTSAEWFTLQNFLGDENEVGGQMKEPGLEHWRWPNHGATNTSGFTGVAGGLRNTAGGFSLGLDRGYWWTRTTFLLNQNNALYRALQNSSTVYSIGNSLKKYGMSVRCIRD